MRKPNPKPRATQLTEEIKEWFGNGEQDIDMMLRFGIIREKDILYFWNKEGRFKP